MAVGDRERWNEKWSSVGRGTGHRSQLAELVAPWLPDRGTLLDVAGGGAPAAITFATHGLAVTVADVSDVGLQKAREEAALAGLEIDTVQVDLEAEPLPAGPWDVITVANYFQPALFPSMIEQLAADGILGVVIATSTNLERSDKPSRAFLLEPGELPTLVPGLEILHHTEDWRDNGRHEAHLVARRDIG